MNEIDPVFTNTKKTRDYLVNGKSVEITMEFPQELELLALGPQMIDAVFEEAYEKLLNGCGPETQT